MKLHIVSTIEEKTLDVAWFEINTPAGNFVVHRGHAPMIITLSENQPLTIRLRSGKEEVISVQSGVAEINRTESTVILGE